jgi:hypothetical protein
MTQTVFILGAGASREVGLPTSEGLTNDIRTLLDLRFDRVGIEFVSGSKLILEALRYQARDNRVNCDVNPYLHAGRRVSQGMPIAESIDNFLHAHRADKLMELCGKLAIVEAILAAERGSKLWFDWRDPSSFVNLVGTRGTWFSRFWHRYSEDCTYRELEQRSKSLSFVVFNYDRCVEHFLLCGLKAYYGLTEQNAVEVVSQVRVFHPYGSIGPLPWAGRRSAVAFGGELSGESLLDLSGQIKTFTEGEDPDSSEIADIRRVLAEADRIVFLGFAFHPQNLRLLWPKVSERGRRTLSVFGTAFKISESDVRLIVGSLAESLGVEPGSITLRNDLECSALFHEFKTSLSLL